MPHRLTATAFLIGTALLVLLKQPVATFCNCSKSFFIHECDCECAPEDPCSHQQDETTPCDDCNQQITLEVEDHFWEGLKQDALSHLEIQNESYSQLSGKIWRETRLPKPLPPPPPRRTSLFLILGNLRL